MPQKITRKQLRKLRDNEEKPLVKKKRKADGSVAVRFDSNIQPAGSRY